LKSKAYKFIIRILIYGILTTLIAGCSVRGSFVDKDLKDLRKVEKKNLKEVTITFCLPGYEKPDAQKVLKVVEEQAKNALNVKLNFIWFPDKYYQNNICGKLDLGDSFEVFLFKYDSFKDEFNSGNIKDISKLLPKYAPKLYKSFTKEEIRGSMIDGKLVTVPRRFEQPDFPYVVIREDLRIKYKLPELKSLDDYGVYLKTIKDKEKGIIPGEFYYDSLDLFARANDYIVLDAWQKLVYKRDDPRMKIVAWEQTPEFRRYVTILNDWRNKGYINSYKGDINDSGITYNKTMNNLVNGKISSMIGGYGLDELLNSKYHQLGKFKSYVLYPDKAYQKNFTEEQAIAFNINGANVERAIMFLEWIQSNRENYNLFMYGTKEGKFIFGDGSKKASEGLYYLNWGGQNAFVNEDFLDNNFQQYSDQIKQNFKILPIGKYPPHMGFYPDYTSVLEDVVNRQDAYSSSIDQPLYSGQLTERNLSIAISSLKKVGTEKILEVLQGQLDKWRSGNKK